MYSVATGLPQNSKKKKFSVVKGVNGKHYVCINAHIQAALGVRVQRTILLFQHHLFYDIPINIFCSHLRKVSLCSFSICKAITLLNCCFAKHINTYLQRIIEIIFLCLSTNQMVDSTDLESTHSIFKDNQRFDW